MPVLSEYGSIDLDLTRSQAEAIQRTGFVDVSPAPAERWRVTASSYIGSLVVDGVELLVRPKINPENLFLLLEPGLPPSAWRKEAFDYDISSDLLPSVIAFFARTVETTLGRGVLRSYLGREDSLVALRGRLDVVGQFKRAGVLTPVACTYQEFTEDVIENRVLRAAIRLALSIPRVDSRERQRLMRQLVALEGVADPRQPRSGTDRGDRAPHTRAVRPQPRAPSSLSPRVRPLRRLVDARLARRFLVLLDEPHPPLLR